MRNLCILLLLHGLFSIAKGQENYEIQVYGSQTQQRNSSIFELHSNYTFKGEHNIVDNVRPTFHSLHETVEITHGLTDIFELGIYLFMNDTPDYGYKVVGTHIRPRVMAPAKWNLPVGISLSTEFGYQRPEYSAETWNVEVRPIIDKQINRLYICFNPSCGIALESEYQNAVPVFEPNVKVSYAFLKHAAIGAEYYGDMGAINAFEPASEQTHTLFATFDLLNNVQWELNAGIGIGMTPAADDLIAKVLIGRRVYWKN